MTRPSPLPGRGPAPPALSPPPLPHGRPSPLPGASLPAPREPPATSGGRGLPAVRGGVNGGWAGPTPGRGRGHGGARGRGGPIGERGAGLVYRGVASFVGGVAPLSPAPFSCHAHLLWGDIIRHHLGDTDDDDAMKGAEPEDPVSPAPLLLRLRPPPGPRPLLTPLTFFSRSLIGRPRRCCEVGGRGQPQAPPPITILITFLITF